jgi:hypothetical protein
MSCGVAGERGDPSPYADFHHPQLAFCSFAYSALACFRMGMSRVFATVVRNSPEATHYPPP